MAKPFTTVSGEQKQNKISVQDKPEKIGMESSKSYISRITTGHIDMGKSSQHRGFESSHVRNSDSFSKFTNIH